MLIDSISSLIQRHNRRKTENVSHGSYGSDPFQCSAGVKTARRVIPAKHTGPRSKTLDNGHTLALAAGNASDESIAYFCVGCVGDVDGSHEKVFVELGVFFLGVDAGGPSKNKQHLTGLDTTVRTVDNGLHRSVFGSRMKRVELGNDVFVEGCIATHAFNGEVLPCNAQFTGLLTNFFVTVAHVL
ncbi:hypothetical protein HG531_013202 [Fusarium graminearum]|nr:hypothetical protein HG531_013202 [Fusarium graminearum]